MKEAEIMDSIFEKIEMRDLRPIREIILERLRNAIISGKLKPEDRLIENDIAEKMGVSRTPVREALRQLEIEGLAENVPRKGTVVKGLSKKDIMDIYEIREVLEGLAVRLACANMNEERLGRLKGKIAEMKNSVNDSDPSVYWKLHEQFNDIILNASGNGRLVDQMKQIYEYLSKLRRSTKVMERRRKQAMEEHEAMLRAFENRDELTAEKLGRQHALNARNFLTEEINLT